MVVSLVDSLKCGICKFNRVVSLVLMLFSLTLIFSGASYSAALSPAQYTTLNGILNTHLNYFLSASVVTSYGLPLSAYKVGDRARFGYSNPTEWGYLLQAYIAAVERGKISKTEAASKIATTLNTVNTLQDNNLQVYNGGLFYPYAFFIPLNVLPDLDQDTLNTTFTKINAMMGDTAGYYYGSSSAYSFGFVVATSPMANDISYSGIVPSDGKNIFETLSEAYIALSTFNALQQKDNSKDFTYFMTKSPNMVDHMKTVQAYLYPTYRPTLIVTNSNTVGGTVASDSGGINCGSTCSHSYAIGTLVTLTAATNIGYSFAGWSGACIGSGVALTCPTTMLAAKNVTANFVPNYTLTVINANVKFGTVTSNVGGISCGTTCSANFPGDTTVTLTAIPVNGYEFSGWGGAWFGVCGYANSCTVTMDTAQTVTANFAVFKIHQPIWKRVINSIIQM